MLYKTVSRVSRTWGLELEDMYKQKLNKEIQQWVVINHSLVVLSLDTTRNFQNKCGHTRRPEIFNHFLCRMSCLPVRMCAFGDKVNLHDKTSKWNFFIFSSHFLVAAYCSRINIFEFWCLLRLVRTRDKNLVLSRFLETRQGETRQDKIFTNIRTCACLVSWFCLLVVFFLVAALFATRKSYKMFIFLVAFFRDKKTFNFSVFLRIFEYH